VAVLLQELKTLVRVRTVAHNIAQTPYLSHLTLELDVIQHRPKSSQIGVNISHNGIAHISTIPNFT
jgi:hypothetical protein